MKITPQNSFRLSVILGLSVIVLLVVALAGVGLWRMTETRQQVQAMVSHNSARIALVHRMKEALRAHFAASQLALHVQDPVRRKEETENAERQRTAFFAAQAEFSALPVSTEEKAILDRLHAQARLAPVVEVPSKPASAVADVIAATEAEIATTQTRMLEALDRLMTLQQQEVESAAGDVRKVFEFTRLHMLILASFAIGAGLMVAPMVIRKANRQADTLRNQAMFDDQTRLPNRLLLIDRLRQAAVAARHEQRTFALMLIDVDHFGAVNTAFGRAVGDQVLQYVSACIQTCLNETDTLARMDGDEFAALSLSVKDPDEAIALVQLIRQSINQPLEIAGRRLEVSASVGVAMFPHHGEDPESLLVAAGQALGLARRTRRGYRLYSADMGEGVEDRVALIHELREVIDRNQLTLHYQPRIEIGANRVSGVEALVRWQHPVNGLMSPERFIPLAEQIGLIKPITNWVLDTAMRQYQDWYAAGMRLPMSMMVTAASVQDPAFPEQMAARLERCGVPAANFEIEIKETAAIAEPQQALECLRKLKGMGFQIAIGDFGTGESSMLFLTEYLVANVKIDRKLVRSMADNRGGAMAVRAAVNLGHTLGLHVVAKGVENQDAWDVLRGLGCNAAQGFFLSRPLPAAELLDWLHTSPWAAPVKAV